MRSLVRFIFTVSVIGIAALVARDMLLAPASVPSGAAPAAATARAATPVPLSTRGVVSTGAPAASTPFSLTLSDADLTRAAATAFPQTVSGVTVSDPVVRVQPTGVRLVASARVLFGMTQFVMTATPVVANGSLAVRVDSATLAGVGLPESTKSSISDTMRTAVARLVPANVRVSSVALAAGALTVQGATR